MSIGPSFGVARRRLFASGAVVFFALASMVAGEAQAQSYPYPVQDIAIELSMPVERFERWWAGAPTKMKSELTGLPLGKWRPTVLCDYLGFRLGTPEGVECREREYRERMAAADQWNADGSYKGPSEECLARNKTDKWGRIICN